MSSEAIFEIMSTGNTTQKNRAIQVMSSNLTDSEKMDRLSDIFSEINYNRRRDNLVQNFTKQIITQENNKKFFYKKYLESDTANGLIYGPTQLGKSNATIQFILACFELGVPAIVSTDNRSDQIEQLFTRVQIELTMVDDQTNLMKVSDRKFDKNLKQNLLDNNHKFVIFCLDN
jgi:hypothetical protein